MRRFFLGPNEINAAGPVIQGSDAKHIRTVLRSKPGDELILFDGQGSDYHGRITKITTKGIHLTVLDRFPSANESPIHITIGQALIRSRKMDRIIRHFTELGGNTFIPFSAKRSMVKSEEERFEKRRHRWQKIAAESLKQCGRSKIPRIESVQSFQEIIATWDGYDLCIIFDNNMVARSVARSPESTKTIKRILALVGPEGGFTTEEVGMAHQQGFVTCHMGPRILKSDTALIAAVTLIQQRFGDLASPKRT